MPEYPPFMNAYGNLPKILKKMQQAQTPTRFTQDFLGTVLGFSGGSSKPFIALAKRIGFLATDGAPTELYKRFRNPDQSGGAMAAAIRRGYPELYKRNEFAHALDAKKLEGLIKEATGLEDNSQTLRAIAKTFQALKEFADFDSAAEMATAPTDETDDADIGQDGAENRRQRATSELRFAYTIYLNLPNTTDVSVFNAIFKSLRENLLT